MKKMNLKLISLSAVIFAVQMSAQAAVVATVNGKSITDEDLQSIVSNVPEVQKQNLLNQPASRKQLISTLIDQELMYQDALSKKIDSSKEFITAMNAFKKQALVNLLVSKQLAPKVTNDAVKNYYTKNKLKYTNDQVHAQHILVDSEKDALAILSEVKKPGVDFQKVAETKSKDPSAKNNRGDVGFFARDMFDPAFVDAAFSTKVGEITGPVKSAFGYHVIKVIERTPGKNPEYAEVESKVRTDLQRDILQGYVSSLKSKAKIKQ
jgi:peptidyl-prolyl cis-trans isomerase C